MEIIKTDFCLNCGSNLVYNHLFGYHCISCKVEGMEKVGKNKWVAVDDILNSLRNIKKATEEQYQFELLDNIIDELCQK